MKREHVQPEADLVRDGENLANLFYTSGRISRQMPF
jgi:hypothetical protein